LGAGEDDALSVDGGAGERVVAAGVARQFALQFEIILVIIYLTQ